MTLYNNSEPLKVTFILRNFHQLAKDWLDWTTVGAGGKEFLRSVVFSLAEGEWRVQRRVRGIETFRRRRKKSGTSDLSSIGLDKLSRTPLKRRDRKSLWILRKHTESFSTEETRLLNVNRWGDPSWRKRRDTDGVGMGGWLPKLSWVECADEDHRKGCSCSVLYSYPFQTVITKYSREKR